MRTETTFRRLEDDAGVIEARRRHVEAVSRLREFQAVARGRALPIGVITFQGLEDARELERLRAEETDAERARGAAEAQATRQFLDAHRPLMAAKLRELDRRLGEAQETVKEILALRTQVADVVGPRPVLSWGDLVPVLLIPEGPSGGGGLETWRRALKSSGWL